MPHVRRLAWPALLLTVACASEAPGPAPVQEPAPRVAISADWLNNTVSFLDANTLLAPGGTLEGALIERLDLSPYGQAPLSLAVTDDGRLAVVLLSRGIMSFVGARLGVEAEQLPQTGAAVVIVDITARQVVADFPTSGVPIVAAIDSRSQRAFVSFLGGPGPGSQTAANGSIGVYDLTTLEEIERVELVPFVEGLAINDAGTRGAAIGATNGLYMFDPDDLEATLSQTPLRLADDSSGVTFVAGTDRLVVANSRNPSTYTVIDASNLNAPVILDEGEPLDAVPFMVAAVPHREEVVMPLSGTNSLRLLHLDVSRTPARMLHDIEVPDIRTFPQAVTVDPTGQYVFVGAAASKELVVFDLATGHVQRSSWLDRLGPTALVVVP